MNNPELYNQFNQLQVRDAEEIIQKFNGISSQTNDACDLLDIGAGCGEVLAKVIVKKLKINLRKVVGTDISSEMVEFAKKNHEDKLVKFHCCDVLDGKTSSDFNVGLQYQSFDVVTSFYCLHWIQDLRNAVLSIKSLLKPNGKFICSLLKTHIIFDAYVKVATDEKFSKYMKDVQKFIPPTYYIIDPVKTLSKLFTELGFEIKLLEHKSDNFDYETRSNFKNSMKSVNPFVSRMNEKLQEEFMDELADFVEGTAMKNKENIVTKNFNAPYEIAYICVSKSDEI